MVMPFGLVFLYLYVRLVVCGWVMFMKFQRIEDMRVDHDLTIRQIAEFLGVTGMCIHAMKREFGRFLWMLQFGWQNFMTAVLIICLEFQM